MVSVAEQFSNLRNTLGSVLGIFTILRWLQTGLAKLTGRPLPASAGDLTPGAFASFEGRSVPSGSSTGPTASKPSKKPLIVFLLAVFGLPYLMGKLIRALERSQEEGEVRRRRIAGIGVDGQPLPPNQLPVDASKLDFRRVMYDFTPDTGAAVQGVDLEVKKGDLVAVLSKTDPMGNASEWWRCRARDGRVGYLPGVYLGPVHKNPAQIMSASQSGSRTSSLNSQSPSTAGLMTGKKEAAVAPKVESKVGDISVDSFQKGGFYS
jgi:peroxin-13